MLEVCNIHVGYPEKEILHGIDMTAQPGQLVALVGPNGAGKTTMIRAMSGVLPLRQGTVTAFGKDISRLSPTERAKLIAVVPQANQLPGTFTGWQTVILGRTPYLNWIGHLSQQDQVITRQVMQQTATLEFANRQVGQLSGGEQQRLLLARALAQSAPVLLLDEPTTHLDIQFQFNLMADVRRLAKEQNLVVIMAMHDLNLVSRFCDQVALLNKGQLVNFGTPVEVLTAETLSEVYQIQIEIHPDGKEGQFFIMPTL
jgi:iron complex transport system ATP-binding protein